MKVLIKRILFDNTNQAAVDFFNDNYRNQDSIDYLTAIRDIVNNNIAYTLDEELRDMPYRTAQYTGKFDVLSISNSKREVVEDGVTVKQAIKLYTLDSNTRVGNFWGTLAPSGRNIQSLAYRLPRTP